MIRNAPLLDDGTPMPTRYWLVGADEQAVIGRLESTGAIDVAEAEIDDVELARAHAAYAAERDAAIPADHVGPVPTGGVGGTRRGHQVLPRPLGLVPGRRRRSRRAGGSRHLAADEGREQDGD